MKKLVFSIVMAIVIESPVLGQGFNRLVYGPLEGDNAGILTVHNGEHIEIEMWIHPSYDNPSCLIGLAHALMSEDAIIAERNGAVVDSVYDEPYWAQVFVDGPFVHEPGYPCPVPEEHTTEILGALASIFPNCDSVIHIVPEDEWSYYGSFLMVCNDNVPTGQTYYPFSEGWYPHSCQGTVWSWEGGGTVPEQDFCGLYFEEIITCDYIPGDCDHNWVPLELMDIMAMINNYRGIVAPYFQCDCGLDPLRPNFAATADPNGNCTPNELNDIVTEIGAYRGSSEVSGCPDCPGSGEIIMGTKDQR
jgi:hypothetical protein